MPLNLAYKFVAMTLMVAEANFFCAKTGLSPGHSYTVSDVRTGSHIGPFKPKDFTGSIITDEYLFGFGWGHLANFRKRGFMPQESERAIRERNLELAKLSSLIDTNGAYQLATNWLASLHLDIRTLEAKYRLNVFQWQYSPEGTAAKAMQLPVYTVEWRGFILRTQPRRESAVVSLTVFGATKELVEYHLLDDSLFLRPKIQIKDAQKLLSIPDAEFTDYTTIQKSNLLTLFASINDIKVSESKDLLKAGTNMPNSDESRPVLRPPSGRINGKREQDRIRRITPSPQSLREGKRGSDG